MMDIRAEIEGLDEVERALDNLEIAVSRRGMTTVLKSAGQVLRRRAIQSFRQETAPEYARSTAQGKAWEPLSELTIAQRRHGPRKSRSDKALQDTGTGRRSIAIDVDPVTMSVAVGTSLQYMIWQQWGTKPYTITPKSAEFLRFLGPEGELLSVTVVEHPGIPARPFLGYNMSDISGILMLISDHLMRAVS